MFSWLTGWQGTWALRADSPELGQLGFQDPASPAAEGIIALHNEIFFYVVLTCIFVFWLLFTVMFLFHAERQTKADHFVHGTAIEIVWTITPALILMAIAVPSFSLLYSMDEVIDPKMTMKVMGHQWYWTYEYSDFECENESISFDSYLIPDEDLQLGHYRLLEVDNRAFLPVETHIRLLITSADVLHSWAVPSLGVKLDACPGRLNQTSVFIKREGVFYGQCSEICGLNHGFMPIVVEAVPMDVFLEWMADLGAEI